MTAVRDAALRFHDAGITVVRVRNNGSKEPVGRWGELRTNPPTRQQVANWFTQSSFGLGILPGTGHPPLMNFDFEPQSNTADFNAELNDAIGRAGLADLWFGILDGYSEATPRGGWHVLFKVEGATEADLKGRKVIVRDGQTFMEIRGAGNMLIVAPSKVGTGDKDKAYQVTDGGIETIATISAEDFRHLLIVFESLSSESTKQTKTKGSQFDSEPKLFTQPTGSTIDLRPGDDFEARTDWEDPLLLGGTGARIVRHEGQALRWLRPANGSPSNAESSGTTNFNGSGLFHCFSANWPPFEGDTAYSKFAVYTLLHHGGDFTAASKTLRAKGYGTTSSTNKKPASPSAADPSPKPMPTLTEQEADHMLDELRAFLPRFVYLPDDRSYDALTLFIAYLHCWRLFDFAPRLVATSPVKRCGKSRLLTVIRHLTTNALSGGDWSSASMYRLLDEQPDGYLMIDEADTIFGRNANKENGEAIRKMLNVGFEPGSPAMRVEGKGVLKVRTFETFAPAVIVGISKKLIPETVRDRAINFMMKRQPTDRKVERFRHRDIPHVFHPMRDELASAIAMKVDTIADIYYDLRLPDSISDRAQDLWMPLVAVAAAFGSEWKEVALGAAHAFDPDRMEESDGQSEGTTLLRDIRDVFGSRNFLPTNELLDGLRAIEESGWDWLNPKRLSTRLVEYGIQSTRGRVDGKQVRGYERNAFSDTFDTYLSTPPESVTSVTSDTSVTTSEPTTTVASVIDLLGGTVVNEYTHTGIEQ